MIRFIIIFFIFMIGESAYGQSIRTNYYSNFDVDANSFIVSDAGYFIPLNKTSTISINQRITKINKNRLLLGIGSSYIVDRNRSQFSASAFFIDNSFLYDVLYRISPINRISTDIISSHELSGIDGITVFSNGITTDVNIKPITVVGGYIHQNFSDDNVREVYVGNVIYSDDNLFRFSIDNKFNKSDRVSPNYFSPELYTTHKLRIGYNYKTKNDNYIISPEMQVGKQNINKMWDNLYGMSVNFKGRRNKFGIDGNISYINTVNEYNNYGIFIMNLKTNFNTK